MRGQLCGVDKMRIILASKSPRRREILSKLFPKYEIIVEEIDESVPCGMHPREAVEQLAVKKGMAVALSKKLEFEGEIVSSDFDKTESGGLLAQMAKTGDDIVIISSDTLVELDARPLGKPSSETDAVDMLLSLSGRAHNVHTGVSVYRGGRIYSGVASSAVYFKVITPEDALEYVKTGEPMDKAGAYAIQGIGGKFVEGYEGDFDTIVGLSQRLLKKLLREAIENE